MGTQDNKEEKNGFFSEKDRGTQDELEVLKLIIDSQVGLKARVLNKLRENKMNAEKENKRKS